MTTAMPQTETGKARLLLVDDNAEQTALFARFLRQAGYETQTVKSGTECLQAVNGGEFDAVLLDYRMPDMDGLQVLSELKNRSIDTPVVMLTGQGDERVAAESMKCGAYDYVVKSSEMLRGLPAIIDRVVSKHSLEKRLKEAERARLQKHLELAMLHQIANAVNASLDLNLICHQALEKILDLLDLQIGMVHLASKEREELCLKSYLGLDQEERARLDKLSSGGALFSIAESSDERSAIALSFDRIAESPEFQGLKQSEGSFMLAPLRSKGHLLGLLSAGSREKRRFTPDELQLFRAIGGQISIAIANANLFEEVSRQTEEIKAKNRELVDAQQRLIEAERRVAVGQVGVAVRHEINNPLTAILGQTQILLRRRSDLPDEVRGKLETIEELTMRIRDIVRKLEEIKATPVKEYLNGEMMLDLEKVN